MRASCTIPKRTSARSVALTAFALLMTSSLPSHALSYVVALKSPIHTNDYVQITNPDGVFGIHTPGFGSHIDRGFMIAPRIDESRLSGEFGLALDAMQEILSKGLPPLSHSYVALLEHPQGNLGSLHASVLSKSILLNQPNQAVLTDGFPTDTFSVETKQIQTDFGAALTTATETRAAGQTPSTYIVLLENPDGTSGKVLVTDERGTATVDVAGKAVNLDKYAASIDTFKADKAQVTADFGEVQAAQPKLPIHFTLFFEKGNIKLTTESQAMLEKVLEDVRLRPAPEISIKGHTDTIGTTPRNEKLAKERADYVASQIKGLGIALTELGVEGFGERIPLVQTPENTEEPKNRRVEIAIR